ncbi:cytochrome P450, partial [Oryctes borbonicus]
FSDLFAVMERYMNEFRPLFRACNGSKPEVHFMKPEHLEIVMNNSIHITKGLNYNQLHSWLGQGLLTSTGPKWFQHRKLITPTFHFKILENFMTIFVEKTGILLKILDAKANVGSFNIYTDITHCALDIICETAMGVNVNVMSDEDNEYIKAVYDITEVLFWKVLHPYVPDFMFKLLPQGRRLQKDLIVLHGFSNKVIADRKKLLESRKSNSSDKVDQGADDLGIKKRKSFLDLLLEASENGKVLSDTDIREEVDTFMFEGHDTTTAAISWTLLLLGNHPEIQEKAYQEISGVLRDKSTPSTIAELNELKYLECIIKESLRMFPSVPFISRHLLQDIQIGAFYLKKLIPFFEER